MKSFFPPVLAATALVAASSLSPVSAQAPAPGEGGAAPLRPVTIMPLGDSITEGAAAFNVYRAPLLQRLKEAGYNVVYVGSKGAQTVSAWGPLAHEGYGGKNVQFLANSFERLYRAHPADVLLVHAGHNQFADQKPVPGMLLSLRSIIGTARRLNPRVTILLAQVIPSGKLPKYSYIPEFNAAVEQLGRELDTPAQRLIVVNQADGFDWTTDTVGDTVHPNEKGAEKMAAKWFEALQKILPREGTRLPAVAPSEMPAATGTAPDKPTPAAAPTP